MDFIQNITDERLKKKLNDIFLFFIFIKKRLMLPVSSRDFNILGVCDIFHIDPRILPIMVTKGILTNSSKTDDPRYGWGGIEITEIMLMSVVKALEEISNKQIVIEEITEEIPESKEHTVSNENEQQKPFIKQTVDDNIDKLVQTKELHENGKEKFDNFLKKVTNTESNNNIPLNVNFQNRTNQRWSEEELQFLRENYNKRNEYIANALNRTISSVRNAKSIMKRTNNLYVTNNTPTIDIKEQEINWHEELWSEVDLEDVVVIWTIEKINSAVNYLNNYKQNPELSEDQLFDCEFKLEALDNEIKRRKENITEINTNNNKEIQQDNITNENNKILSEKDIHIPHGWTKEKLDCLIDMIVKGEELGDIAVVLSTTVSFVSKYRNRIIAGDLGEELKNKLISQVDAPITEEDIKKAQTTIQETIGSMHTVEKVDINSEVIVKSEKHEEEAPFGQVILEGYNSTQNKEKIFLADVKIHIGEKIKQRAEELRIGPTELGEMINTSKQNITSIYKREYIDTELLQKISKALKFDFFSYYLTAERLKNKETISISKTKQVPIEKKEIKKVKKFSLFWGLIKWESEI